jgi:hypothetical protein
MKAQMFKNHYECRCGAQWHKVNVGMCRSTCSKCKEFIPPVRSEDAKTPVREVYTLSEQHSPPP